VRNELKQRRWQRGGKQSIVLHNGPLDVDARRWIAVLEVGCRAALDGVTALQEAGLKGLSDTEIHIATPKGSTPIRRGDFRLHETRRYREEDVITSGIPRMTPAVAAVHAALWAVSDRQAKLFLVMTVQQRLAKAVDIATVLGRVKRHKRRRVLIDCITQIAAGCHSLHELDVGAAMRRRGLPEPSRQAIRRREDGTEYLDNDFPEFELVLEVDGIQHNEAIAKLDDFVRDINEIVGGRSVMRLSSLAWALDQEKVLDALEKVFRAKGWRPDAEAA
jgi:hypothetical protein